MGSSNGHRKKAARNSDSRAATDLERRTKRQPVEANADTAFHTRVGISIHPFRCRPCDTDGPAHKAITDALVHCGVIRDDSAKEVAWFKFIACTKVKNEDEEKTVIIIEEV